MPPDNQNEMTNELLLIISILVTYGGVILFYRFFGKNGLWIRNNGSTMISQLLNTLLYTFLAFYGTYSMQTLVSILISSYALFFVTSLLDTPFVYWARTISEKHHEKDQND